jgi:hypothetical protein
MCTDKSVGDGVIIGNGRGLEGRDGEMGFLSWNPLAHVGWNVIQLLFIVQ